MNQQRRVTIMARKYRNPLVIRQLLPGLTSLSCLATLMPFSAAHAWQGVPAPKLHVSGNRLIDPNGRLVVLHGWYMATDPYFAGDGRYFNSPTDYAGALRYFNAVTDTLTDTSPKYGFDHGWYCNYVRFDPDLYWFGDYADGSFSMAKLQAFTTNILIPYIQHCRDRGIYVVIMPNVSKPDNTTTPELQNALKTILGYWAATPGIKSADNVSFELMNEPINARATDGTWGSGSDKYWSALSTWLQPIVNTIRSTGADNIVWVPGLGYQSQYQGFIAHPIDGGAAGNIGYAAHFYPAYVPGDPNNPVDVDRAWNNNYRACADRYPMLVTECNWKRFLPGDNEYWHLFDGITGDPGYGFGTAARRNFDASHVGFIGGIVGDLLGPGPNTDRGDPAGPLNFNPARDEDSRAVFHWFHDYRGLGGTEATVSAFSRIEAGRFDELHGGLKMEAATDGFQDLGYISSGDYAVYRKIDFGSDGAGKLLARIAGYGGQIQVRLDSAGGTSLGTFAIPSTGDWQNWQTVSFSTPPVTGVHDVYLVFQPSLNLRWFLFGPADSGAVVTVANNGLEAPALSAGDFAYGPNGAAWIFGGSGVNSGAGVASNGSGFTYANPNAPQGTQVGFLQSLGSMNQTVTGVGYPGMWTIRFQAAARRLRSGFGQTIQVYLDDHLVGLASPYNLGYDLFTIRTPVGAGPHTLTLKGSSTSDDTAFVDALEVRAQNDPAALSPGRYRITPRNGLGECLDLAGGSTAPGTRVQLGDFHGKASQLWDVTALVDGNYRIAPAADANQSLGTVNFDPHPDWIETSTNISTPWSVNPAQEWQFQATDSGFYRLTPASNTQMCLDLNYAHNTAGTPLDTYFYFSGQHQQWSFQSSSDVSALVNVKRGGFSYNRTLKQFAQQVTLTNVSGGAITGPILLALDTLNPGVTLANASGFTQADVPTGSPYLLFSASGLAGGASVTATLQFANPSMQGITYSARVIAGPGQH